MKLLKQLLNISLFIVICVVSMSEMKAQTTFPANGAPDDRNTIYHFYNGTIVVSPEQTIENGALVIQQDKIIAVGNKVSKPNNAISIDLNGKWIYPSFIELVTNIGLPKMETKKATGKPIIDPTKKGAYAWNDALHSEFRAVENLNSKDYSQLRNIGFGTAITHRDDGIARGTGTAILLQDKKENKVILTEDAASFYAFSKGSSKQQFPSSLMGSIALLRQTFLDGDWYKAYGHDKEKNLTLKQWNENLNFPLVFDAGNVLNILRAQAVGREFNANWMIFEDGTAYQRVEELKAKNIQLITPLNFPLPYDVSHTFDEKYISLKQMKHWEMAPSNADILEENGIAFALSSRKTKPADFLTQLRQSVARGLSKSGALNALTMRPATWMKLDQVVGSLAQNKIANFLIADKDIFEEDAKILENWIAGKRYVIIQEFYHKDDLGNYDFTISGDRRIHKIELFENKGKLSGHYILNDSTKYKLSVDIDGDKIHFAFSFSVKDELDSRFSGWKKNKYWKGKGELKNGDKVQWELKNKTAKNAESTKEQETQLKSDTIGKIIYPFLAYGNAIFPEMETVVIRNATVWTNESEGILEGMDVLVEDGKIAKIGKDLSTSGAKEIEATGKHLTCGIVDEHSHIAISKGVNEGSQASSAEVRIGDVVNSEDINIYRQLAGGVTTSQLLHGSANPIGGQSAIIKLKWGALPSNMLIPNAPGFIKFALGENVKQSNWGAKKVVRFPQTRMGVEQVFEDHFQRAKEYELNIQSTETRRDLELDALLEILNHKRFVTCHSYVQSEINMLMKVAERFDFKINTFTHILEGYKLADKMKEHGVAGSTFSDWWAYKFEVNDAIPYNAALLQKMEILTGINSDDAEMARRLNTEAAKAVKYGGISEEDAWKMVTLNPAKMLHLDDRIGSIKEGKDADIVIWSGHPLSIYTIAEKTFIEGVCYFDVEENNKKEIELSKERLRLIQKMIAAKKNGSKTQTLVPDKKKLWHCDDVHDVWH